MKKEIELKNLSKYYGKNRGIENINLSIKSGTIYGFIGPNGAGKSTTIKSIMNFINSTGEIYIDGILMTKNNNDIKNIIGYLPSEIHLYEELTVKQMLNYSKGFYKENLDERITDLVTKLNLDVNKKISELSLGNLKKVGIIICLMHNPKIIIMDEATSGLDPLVKETFYSILKEEKNAGKTILFSSHDLKEVKKICDEVAIIKDGKIIKQDDIEKISDNNVKVKIVSNDIENIIKDIKISKLNRIKDCIEFIYDDDINKLINILKKYNIKKLIIEEIDIEDIFIDYYK